jgi:hypothetical protein
MKLRYYKYTIGEAQLCGGEMHASLHEIIFDKDFLNCDNAFVNQLKGFLNNDGQNRILRKHLERGFNISNEDRTCLIDYPDFPLKSFREEILDGINQIV